LADAACYLTQFLFRFFIVTIIANVDDEATRDK